MFGSLQIKVGKNPALIAVFLIFIVCFSFVISCGGQTIPKFDKISAFDYLIKQCDFGPRHPGSEGHKKTLKFLSSEMRKYTDMVSLQNFPFSNPASGKSYLLTNIIASFGQQGQRILLATHWDTRPWADLDPNPKNHDKPIPGANDGASGVAVLLEIARILKENPPNIGVDIIFFDGEDSGRSGYPEEYLQGSRYFAQNKDPQYNPKYGIVVDMIGDRNLTIYAEENSARYAPEIVNKVWAAAEKLEIPEFDRKVKHRVTDDHLPLLEVGIPCINIIDFDYPYWHTLEDTPDKCSPESLEKVGRVILALIYGEK